MSQRPGQLRIAEAEQVESLLDELAQAVVQQVGETTALVGIVRRGAPLARLLGERLARLGRTVETGELALKRYSDDLEVLHDRPDLDPDSLDLDVDGRHLILMDDVVFTGESLFRAACHLRGAGARRIETAVLCARGRPLMPLHTEYVACRLDVGDDWIVDCQVPPYEEDLGITIKRRP